MELIPFVLSKNLHPLMQSRYAKISQNQAKNSKTLQKREARSSWKYIKYLWKSF